MRCLFTTALLLLMGCGSDPTPLTPLCTSNCDTPLGPPTAHSQRVEDCLAQFDFDLQSLTSLAAEQARLSCLIDANAVAIPVLAQKRTEMGRSTTEEVVAEIFSEFRYASLCSDLEAAGEDELVVARCRADRETELATAVASMLPWEEEAPPWPVLEPRDVLDDCYMTFDATAEADPGAAYSELLTCAIDRMNTLVPMLVEAQCSVSECVDRLLVESYVKAGVETSVATTSRMCNVLAEANGEIPSVRCQVNALAERFVGVAASL